MNRIATIGSTYHLDTDDTAVASMNGSDELGAVVVRDFSIITKIGL